MTGAVFAVVFAVAFLTGGDTPDTDASGLEVISHYEDAGEKLPLILGLVLAAVLFLFFAGVLREALRANDAGPAWLATVAFGGGVVYATALAIFAMGQIMLLDASDLGDPQVAQALNIFDNDNFFPAVVGLATFLLATAWQTLRSRVLPAWVGWVSLVLGLLAVAGPVGFLAFLLFPIWVLVVSILLYRGTARPPVTEARPGDGLSP
ncbi:MAG TPA: hypothetical protein VHH09_08100 [Acidimicrobiales bacterium]|nr:hypothetical protein [Acidimicrobiales bacterium]